MLNSNRIITDEVKKVYVTDSVISVYTNLDEVGIIIVFLYIDIQ